MANRKLTSALQVKENKHKDIINPFGAQGYRHNIDFSPLISGEIITRYGEYFNQYGDSIQKEKQQVEQEHNKILEELIEDNTQLNSNICEKVSLIVTQQEEIGRLAESLNTLEQKILNDKGGYDQLLAEEKLKYDGLNNKYENQGVEFESRQDQLLLEITKIDEYIVTIESEASTVEGLLDEFKGTLADTRQLNLNSRQEIKILNQQLSTVAENITEASIEATLIQEKQEKLNKNETSNRQEQFNNLPQSHNKDELIQNLKEEIKTLKINIDELIDKFTYNEKSNRENDNQNPIIVQQETKSNVTIYKNDQLLYDLNEIESTICASQSILDETKNALVENLETNENYESKIKVLEHKLQTVEVKLGNTQIKLEALQEDKIELYDELQFRRTSDNNERDELKSEILTLAVGFFSEIEVNTHKTTKSFVGTIEESDRSDVVTDVQTSKTPDTQVSEVFVTDEGLNVKLEKTWHLQIAKYNPLILTILFLLFYVIPRDNICLSMVGGSFLLVTTIVVLTLSTIQNGEFLSSGLALVAAYVPMP